jgi:FAD/FMN-containing dehydrogenase
MTHSAIRPGRVPGATAALRDGFTGEILVAGDPGHTAARRVWNGAVEASPAVVARCANDTDVVHALLTAREHELPISVRGGGHDWGGRALRDGGVVIDLSGLRQVRVDAGRETAVVQGGAHAGDVIAAAHPHGLAPVTGLAKAVGITGLTLAGGYGVMNGAHGLALDNLLEADVVLPDGRRVRAATDGDADLYWALRGGGGNFGVVTGATFRVHRHASVLSGMFLFPLDQARTVLRGYREVVAEAPGDLTVMAGSFAGPDGVFLLFLLPTWTGAAADGEPWLARLASLGTPISADHGPVSYLDLVSQFDASVVDGRQNEMSSRWLAELSDEAADVIVAALERATSPFSAVFVHHFHGAAAAVPTADTAFALRRDHLQVEILSAWTPQSDVPGVAHRAWVHDLAAALDPMALPGGYPNLLGPAEAARSLEGYGPNLARLLELKSRYDPEAVFSAVPALV